MKINNLHRAEFKETLKIKWKNDVARSESHKFNWLNATLWLRSVHVIFFWAVYIILALEILNMITQSFQILCVDLNPEN